MIEYLEDGHVQREARDVFHISLSTINKWHQLYQTTGKMEDKKPCRSFKKLDPVKLQAYVEEHPSAYLKEIGAAFGCGESSVRKALRRLGITRKKRQNGIRSKNRSR